MLLFYFSLKRGKILYRRVRIAVAVEHLFREVLVRDTARRRGVELRDRHTERRRFREPHAARYARRKRFFAEVVRD